MTQTHATELASLQHRARALKGTLPKRYMSLLEFLHPDEDWTDLLRHKVRNVVQGRSADPTWIERLEEIATAKTAPA